MKVDVKFLYSSSVPFMDGDFDTVYDSRACIDEIPLIGEPINTKNWESYDCYVFKKIKESGKPKLIEAQPLIIGNVRRKCRTSYR